MMHMSSTLIAFMVVLIVVVAGSLVLLRILGGRRLDD
jgi:hypothetical protein